MLWLLYVVYLVVRASIESTQRRAVASAVFGIVAFLDVPLVYLSSRLLRTPGELHPQPIELEASMKVALALFFVPITLMAAGLIVARFTLARQERAARDAARADGAGDLPITLPGGAA
jgi:heme exporter protein C